MDLGNPDAAVREYAVETLKKSLTWAKELGAHVVGTETAYPRLAIEPVFWHPLEDLETTMDILERVNDPKHLRLIFDASNLLQQTEVNDQERYWNTWLDNVGEYMDVLHIKDFSWDKNGEYQPEALGAGVIQYDAISRWLGKQTREIYLLREERNALYAKADVEFLKRL